MGCGENDQNSETVGLKILNDKLKDPKKKIHRAEKNCDNFL